MLRATLQTHHMPAFRTDIGPDTLWNRHESPASVWWFVLLYPVFILAIYQRSRPLSMSLLLSLAVNLFVVSPPETDDAWATRVVRGERVWLEEGLRSSRNNLLVTLVGGIINLYTLCAALYRNPVRTMVGSLGSMVFMLLFFDRMAELYETTRAAEHESEPTQ